MKTTLLSAAVVAAAATAASPAFAGAVLDKIRANDQLVCEYVCSGFFQCRQ